MRIFIYRLFSWCDKALLQSIKPVDTGLHQWLAEPWREGRAWVAPPVTRVQMCNRRKAAFAAKCRAIAHRYRK